MRRVAWRGTEFASARAAGVRGARQLNPEELGPRQRHNGRDGWPAPDSRPPWGDSGLPRYAVPTKGTTHGLARGAASGSPCGVPAAHEMAGAGPDLDLPLSTGVRLRRAFPAPGTPGGEPAVIGMWCWRSWTAGHLVRCTWCRGWGGGRHGSATSSPARRCVCRPASARPGRRRRTNSTPRRLG